MTQYAIFDVTAISLLTTIGLDAPMLRGEQLDKSILQLVVLEYRQLHESTR